MPRPFHLLRLARWAALLLGGTGWCLSLAGAEADEPSDTITAVSSKTSNDYSRLALPDGQFQTEYYALAEGGFYRTPIRDDSIDKMKFMDIARKLTTPLARQNFIPTKNPAGAKLLIMVYWGTTSGTSEPKSENFRYNRNNHTFSSSRGSSEASAIVPFLGSSIGPELSRNAATAPDLYVPEGIQGDIVDERNAEILGYDSEMTLPGGYQITARRIEHDDLVDEIEHDRYFIVLMAYDFQLLLRQKIHKLLWVTRFSIPNRHDDFTAMMPRMIDYAAQYCGQDTLGLLRRPLPQPRVRVGTPKVVAAAEGERSPAETTLIAGPNLLNGPSLAGKREGPPFPAPLVREIAAYEAGKAALQDALAAVIEARRPGEETKAAIDSFNTEHAARIAALDKSAETIRGELAAWAAAHRPAAGALSVDDLLRQFSSSIEGSGFQGSLFTHP